MSTTQALTLAHPQYEDEQLLATIRDTVCKGATPAQFRMFIEVCKSTGLNPFLKEIWYVPSVGVMAARDGYLRVANQHPQFDGMETRVERDDCNIPVKAVCTVWRKDRTHPVICEAYYNEYKKGGNVWSTYPSAMIAKVAEVLALKRSFAINGVVTEEEIGEQHDAKEAQRDYLADKGLEPYVAPKRIGKDAATAGSLPVVSGTEGAEAGNNKPEYAPNVKSPNISPSPEVIRELSAILDDRPARTDMEQELRDSAIRTIELRHAATVAEAAGVLKEVDKPKKSKSAPVGGVSFSALSHFKEVKALLREVTGVDTEYYRILGEAGYKKSNDIKDDAEARRIWKLLATEHSRLKQTAELTAILAQGSEIIGARAFADLLGVHGCLGVADVLQLAGDPLAALLAELKDRVDQRKGGV